MYYDPNGLDLESVHHITKQSMMKKRKAVREGKRWTKLLEFVNT